jgi:hypothetical protein
MEKEEQTSLVRLIDKRTNLQKELDCFKEEIDILRHYQQDCTELVIKYNDLSIKLRRIEEFIARRKDGDLALEQISIIMGVLDQVRIAAKRHKDHGIPFGTGIVHRAMDPFNEWGEWD